MATATDIPTNIAVEVPATAAAAADTAQKNSSLYVGDLDKDVTETQLFELFTQAGPVHSIRVCRDTVTRRSLGYAYVNYNANMDANAAQEALENLNYKELNGRPIRIMWSQRDPNLRKTGMGNIFIKNLEKHVTTRNLHDTFSAFGPILSCKVATDKEGNSKGYGFVHFETAESAVLAIKGVNGAKLGQDSDKVVTVCEFLSRQERGDTGKRFTNIYVKNLPESLQTDAELRKLFEPYGEITSAVVQLNKEGKSSGFGFVNYEDADSAAAAKEALHDAEVDGKKLYVDRAQKKAERENELKRRYEEKRNERTQAYEGKNLYMKNLPEDIDDEKLREVFQEHGNITSVKVMRDDKKKSKGFGFVCFSTSEEAHNAVQAKSNFLINGKPLFICFAQTKAARAETIKNIMQAKQVPALGAMNGRAPQPMGYMPGAPQQGMPFYNMPGPRPAYGMANMYPAMMPYGNMQGRGARGGMPNMMPGNMMMMQPYGNMQAMQNMGGRGGAGGRSMRGGLTARGARGARGDTGRGTAGRGRGAVPQVPNSMPNVPPANVDETGDLHRRLAGMGVDDQKQLLGELLFPRIQGALNERFSEAHAQKLASKITGMFLEMESDALLFLLDTPSELESKMTEALDVLQSHGALPEGLVLEAKM